MASSWPEITLAANEKRHELVLSGKGVSDRIEEGGICEELFNIQSLNFLEISKTSLTDVSPSLGNLTAMTNLVLHSNKITSIPSSIKSLQKLKILDLSRNALTVVPEEIQELAQLHTFNISSNQLANFPNISSLQQLHVLDISNNQLDSLPEGISDPSLNLLNTILASGNSITELPSDLNELQSLKTLNVEDNKLTVIPLELSECVKLKEFNYRGNKLKDRRLAKMMDQCTTKAVLDYLRNILAKEQSEKGKGKSKGKKKKKGKKEEDDIEEIAKNIVNVLNIPKEEVFTVQVTEAAVSARPYIVCCIVKNLNFQKSLNMFKRFINLQTKLHDTLCQKRQVATIATHDLKAVKPPLVYDAKDPKEMKLIPLFRQKEVSAETLVSKLRHEAEEQRKEKKRNTVSGIHKYLDLLKDQKYYPCLLDKEGTILSFPPITNCEITKVSKETTELLIEVTSSSNLDICKKILDEFLQQLLEMGVGNDGATSEPPSDGGAAGGNVEEPYHQNGQSLVVEQVRVLDAIGSLKVVYPSRTDLSSDAYNVHREYE